MPECLNPSEKSLGHPLRSWLPLHTRGGPSQLLYQEALICQNCSKLSLMFLPFWPFLTVSPFLAVSHFLTFSDISQKTLARLVRIDKTGNMAQPGIDLLTGGPTRDRSVNGRTNPGMWDREPNPGMWDRESLTRVSTDVQWDHRVSTDVQWDQPGYVREQH